MKLFFFLKKSRTDLVFQGIPIHIENPEGSVRHWYDPMADRSGDTVMHRIAYGEIPGAPGLDGDPLDVYVGYQEDAPFAYIVTINKPPAFVDLDETKIFLGFRNENDVRAAFLLLYDNPKFFRSIRAVPIEEFRAQVQAGELIKSEGKVRGHFRRDGKAGTSSWIREHFRQNPPQKIHDLPQEQSEVQDRVIAKLLEHPERYAQMYERKFGTRVIDADKAKELFHVYRRNKEKHASSVHAASSALAEAMYHGQVKNISPGTVVFTAGGPASGKTTAVEHIAEMKALHGSAHLLYDTMMSKLDKNKRLIQAALDAGHEVHVLYVHRPADLAARGMLHRAMKGARRTVPYWSLAENHMRAQHALFDTHEEYRSSPRVFFHAIDNSRGENESRPMSIDELRLKRYNNPTDVEKEVKEAIHDEYRKQKGTGRAISDVVYRASLLGRKTTEQSSAAITRTGVDQFEQRKSEREGRGRTGEVKKSRVGPALVFFPLSKGLTSRRGHTRTLPTGGTVWVAPHSMAYRDATPTTQLSLFPSTPNAPKKLVLYRHQNDDGPLFAHAKKQAEEEQPAWMHRASRYKRGELRVPPEMYDGLPVAIGRGTLRVERNQAGRYRLAHSNPYGGDTPIRNDLDSETASRLARHFYGRDLPDYVIDQQHEKIVKYAIAAKKPVPDEVRADYERKPEEKLVAPSPAPVSNATQHNDELVKLAVMQMMAGRLVKSYRLVRLKRAA